MQLHERSFGGFRLSSKPPTRWEEGSSSRCSRRKPEAQSYQPISPAVQQYFLTPNASRKSKKTIKSTRLTVRTGRIQPKKSPVEKGRFRLAESDCIRNGLNSSTFTTFWVPQIDVSTIDLLLLRKYAQHTKLLHRMICMISRRASHFDLQVGDRQEARRGTCGVGWGLL